MNDSMCRHGFQAQGNYVSIRNGQHMPPVGGGKVYSRPGTVRESGVNHSSEFGVSFVWVVRSPLRSLVCLSERSFRGCSSMFVWYIPNRYVHVYLPGSLCGMYICDLMVGFDGGAKHAPGDWVLKKRLPGAHAARLLSVPLARGYHPSTTVVHRDDGGYSTLV